MRRGNRTALLQRRSITTNALGERVSLWTEERTLTGWLDYSAGSVNGSLGKYSALAEESTHVFLCEYDAWGTEDGVETSRLVIDGVRYQLLLADDPMGLGHHWELLLKRLPQDADE